MSGTRVLGTFPEQGPPNPWLPSVELAVPALDLVVQWRRCGRTADYVARYLADAFERHETAQSVLSTAVNELLENAAKFSVDKHRPVRLCARHRGPVVELVVENHTDAQHAQALEQLLVALRHEPPSALFAQRVESAKRGGLGLIILAKDYGAELGARLGQAGEGGLVPVTVRAALRVEEVEQR